MNSDIKSLMDTVKTMDEQIKFCLDMTKNEIEEAGYNFNIADDLDRFTKEQVKSFNSTVIMNIRNKFKINSISTQAEDSTMEDTVGSYDEIVSKTKEEILSFYDSVVTLHKLIDDRNQLVDDVQKVMNEYTNYLNSDEMKEKELQQIEDLRDQINNETDFVKKKKLEEKLHIIESTDTLNFIFDRMTRLKEKEIKSIMESFFDEKKSNYILNRFKDKMKQLKMDGDQYKSLLDIEANFLDKEYHPLNNIFLFNLVRFIAYCDINSMKESTYAQTLLIRTLKLIYHKYKDHDEELLMIEKIRQLDDYFMPFVDIFKEKNTTSPDSEFRVNLKKKREIETLKNIEEAFDELGEPVPEGTIEELTQILRDKFELRNLKEWFNMYNISIDEESSLEELRDIKEKMKISVLKEDVETIDGSEDKDDEIITSGYIEVVDEDGEITKGELNSSIISGPITIPENGVDTISVEKFNKDIAESSTTIIWPDEE